MRLSSVTARVVYTDPFDTSELIEVGAHRLQFGGWGDGFCYHHQSFDCADVLSAEERSAISEAS